MIGKETGCSFIDNLVDGNYEYNHSFFEKITAALRLEFLYLYHGGVKSYSLIDNGETNLYFLQILENTLHDLGLDQPMLRLFSPFEGYVWEKSHESDAVKLLVNEVSYIRQKATADPAVFETLYQAAIKHSGILLLMDKDRDSKYYNYAVKTGKEIHFLNPAEMEFSIENVWEARGIRNFQRAILASDIEREYLGYTMRLERVKEQAHLAEMQMILRPETGAANKNLLLKRYMPEIDGLDEKCRLIKSVISLGDEAIIRQYWDWRKQEILSNDSILSAEAGKLSQEKADDAKRTADQCWKILKEEVFIAFRHKKSGKET